MEIAMVIECFEDRKRFLRKLFFFFFARRCKGGGKGETRKSRPFFFLSFPLVISLSLPPKSLSPKPTNHHEQKNKRTTTTNHQPPPARRRRHQEDLHPGQGLREARAGGRGHRPLRRHARRLGRGVRLVALARPAVRVQARPGPGHQGLGRRRGDDEEGRAVDADHQGRVRLRGAGEPAQDPRGRDPVL